MSWCDTSWLKPVPRAWDLRVVQMNHTSVIMNSDRRLYFYLLSIVWIKLVSFEYYVCSLPPISLFVYCNLSFVCVCVSLQGVCLLSYINMPSHLWLFHASLWFLQEVRMPLSPHSCSLCNWPLLSGWCFCLCSLNTGCFFTQCQFVFHQISLWFLSLRVLLLFVNRSKWRGLGVSNTNLFNHGFIKAGSRWVSLCLFLLHFLYCSLYILFFS